jgi:hypothetical protein
MPIMSVDGRVVGVVVVVVFECCDCGCFWRWFRHDVCVMRLHICVMSDGTVVSCEVLSALVLFVQSLAHVVHAVCVLRTSIVCWLCVDKHGCTHSLVWFT